MESLEQGARKNIWKTMTPSVVWMKYLGQNMLVNLIFNFKILFLNFM
jgi:hypothetical protein